MQSVSIVARVVAAAALLCLPALGASAAPPLIRSLTPAAGDVVTRFVFDVEVELLAPSDVSTLVVELNGEDITAQLSGGPRVYTATLSPGPPLRDENTLYARVTHRNGKFTIEETADFEYLPAKARAQVVSDVTDCVTGPLAHCAVGDFLISNGRARYVIQQANQRESHAVGTFGGNLIDAERVVDGVPQGNDNFFELQPSMNIETVINAIDAEIVNDGQDGTAAIVRTCGPDDLLDDINPSSVVGDAGGQLPPGVDDQDYDVIGCTEYTLEPSAGALEIVTTIESMEGSDVPLFLGDYINGGGELEQWGAASDAAPIPLPQLGVGETLVNWGIDVLSFIGFDEAEGADYGLLLPRPPEVPVPSSSFTTTGVSFVMHGHSIPLVLIFGAPANFVVPAGDAISFRRWFSVGDGSGANAIEAVTEINGVQSGTLRGCVTSAGDPVTGARIAASRDGNGGTAQAGVVKAHWVADASGCYEARIPTGDYLVAAGKEGFPYEGGGSVPVQHLVTVTDGGTAVQDIELPQAGRLRVVATDHLGSALPVRVAVVGFDPSPQVRLTSTIISANDTRSNLFYDQRDGIPNGLTRTEYTGAGGELEIDLEPGEYQVAVSRGSEYSAYTEVVTINGGALATVSAQLSHVLDTTGFISSDYHVHLIESPDSRISRRNRIHSFAGEGVDNLIATDHGAITDLQPDIAALGLREYLHSTPGEEITTFDYGHFNAYPQGRDDSLVQTGGSTDHGGAAPPGEDFPSLGNYNLSPAQIAATAVSDPFNAGLDTAVQINHINSHFAPLRIDTSLTPPASQISPAQALSFRLDPAIANFFHAFPALELWNGATEGAQNEFLRERIGIWMNLLNQGIPTTAITDTDTHTFHNLRQAGGRTWTPSSTDAPADISDPEIGRAIGAGKAIGGQGLFVQAKLRATDGSGGVASLGGVVPSGTPGASTAAGTLVTVGNGEVELVVHVQAPTWAPYDTIEIYRNASTTIAGTTGGTPTLFSALPTAVRTQGTHFSVDTVPVNGSARLETVYTETLSGLAADEWIVVIVKGTRGVSPPLFPINPDNVDTATENTTLADLVTVTAAERGIRALGVTNALYVDVDGNGRFDPPGVSVAP